MMTTYSFSDVSVTQVSELTEWHFPANVLYPTLTDEAFDAAVEKWGARLADPVTHELMLDINCFLIRTPESTILVDAGNGNHKCRPVMTAHHMFETDFLGNLQKAGADPESIDFVVSTHLHQDHCGWNTMLVDDEWVPTFPKADYLFSKRELEHVSQYGRTAPEGTIEHDFYRTFEDTIQPVLLAGLARTLSPDHTLFDDGSTRVWVQEVSGHTPGHLVVHIESEEGSAVLSGDVIHHPLQFADLDMPQVGDVDTALAAQVRRALVERCCEQNTLLMTAHFPAPGRVVRDKDGEFDFCWEKSYK